MGGLNPLVEIPLFLLLIAFLRARPLVDNTRRTTDFWWRFGVRRTFIGFLSSTTCFPNLLSLLRIEASLSLLALRREFPPLLFACRFLAEISQPAPFKSFIVCLFVLIALVSPQGRPPSPVGDPPLGRSPNQGNIGDPKIPQPRRIKRHGFNDRHRLDYIDSVDQELIELRKIRDPATLVYRRQLSVISTEHTRKIVKENADCNCQRSNHRQLQSTLQGDPRNLEAKLEIKAEVKKEPRIVEIIEEPLLRKHKLTLAEALAEYRAKKAVIERDQ